jgi:hypothetical protein
MVNVIGHDIDFEKMAKHSVIIFLNELYSVGTFAPAFLSERKYYLNKCNPTNIDEVSDRKFVSKFNGRFEKLSKKKRISIRGLRITGSFLEFDVGRLEFQRMSFYPREIYHNVAIKRYLLPLDIKELKVIRKCKLKS